MKFKKSIILTIAGVLSTFSLKAQTASPAVSFYDIEQGATVEVLPGGEETTQAPAEITLVANIETDNGYDNYSLEWRIFKSEQGEENPLITRFTPDSQFTLTSAGGYSIKLYVTFVNASSDTIEFESEVITIVISESKLTCPDGFSPNGDGINDVYNIDCQSIVKLNGGIFNRWGKKLHEFTLENIHQGWDGLYNGSYVPNGAYLLHIDAIGSDGLHYRIRKAINVMKGFLEDNNSTL